MKVPLTDLTIKNTKSYLAKISQIIKTNDFILGKEVEAFEKEFATYLGVGYCVGVASGTDALLLALKAVGVTQNDEVIVPAFSFVASATPIVMLGARPVFVDVKKDFPIIDEEQIEKAI